MSFETILYGVDQGVATITLNRPERLNALSEAMLTELMEALDRSIADGARTILLTASGRGFSSGADLSFDGKGDGPHDLSVLLREYYHPLMLKLADFPLPIVTAVQGAAAGAGCSVALAGDFILAGRSAYFLQAFVNIGLVPDAGATWFLANGIGRARAAEMMMLGERIPADKAAEWGLIYKAVDDDALIGEADALARRLAKGPTQALGMIRRALSDAFDKPLEAVLEIEADNQKHAGYTKDFAEGVAAFREKRAALFSGA